MEYRANLVNGEMIDLPAYNLTIADKLEATDSILSDIQPFRKKIKAVYDCISSIIGKEKTKELLGDFTSIDPNEVQLTYLAIVDSYNDPINSGQVENLNRKLEEANIDKITKLLDASTKVKGIK